MRLRVPGIRHSGAQGKAKVMKVAKHIPNSMTLFNVFVGVAAIMLSLSHEYEKAAGQADQ